MNLRPIEPVDTRGLAPSLPPTGAPIFEWVDPRSLFVDPTYQRGLGERSIRQIRRIVEGFDWTRFKPPVCAFGEGENGQDILRVIDGQHTAIAAASNPNVSTIPVMIVEAPDVQRQAAAFIGQNTERLGVTATQMHVAALAAGDGEAIAMDDVCRAAGVVIRKNPPSGGGAYEPNETMAVGALGSLLKRGRHHAELVLGILAAARFAPIKADHIKAVDALLGDPQFGALDVESLSTHIQGLGDLAMRDAKTFAVTHSVPLWKALASTWFQKAKKRRQASTTVPKPQKVPLAPMEEELADGWEDEMPAPPSTLPADLKADSRPARGGWKPGNQVGRCRSCDTRFRGGPRAEECADCAYGEKL